VNGKTRILTVVHDNGDTAHCPLHSSALLQEVAEGADKGKRGCDACLFDLVGPLDWDRSQIVSYETGERRPACAICGRPSPVICAQCADTGNLSLTDVLNLAADKIADCDMPKRWDSWLYLLLDALEGKATPQAYEQFLRHLQADITRRLESGGW